MMEDNHGIIAAAESDGRHRRLPQRPAARRLWRSSLCLDNNWGAPDNVFFLAELIGRQKAAGQVLDDRVHLVGFSGGAKLIYEIAATPGFPHAIHSVATVAGAFALFHADRPEEGFSVDPARIRARRSARCWCKAAATAGPAAGGLDETGREAHASFRTKVDYWRLVTGTATARGAGRRRAGARPQRSRGPRGVPLRTPAARR